VAINNDIVIQRNKQGEKEFHGSSTDEIALVKFADSIGIKLEKKDISGVSEIVIEGYGPLYFKDIQKIEFSSERKRMTAICQQVDQDGQEINDEAIVMTKGADSVVFERSD
jgi:phospholipid-translocating ATPase